ncbi:hypothetical protein Poli38472_013715 [Pythium oligandrum]|uniref:C2 domain-containing protein n=1 Tax=Pythium oligandrum TaxID=41045 RepID=A0A8K1CDG8_PYTOL|nr:hypothetical protein Poli38472_013715 [Pythium oligandrum]|eukprot:TMW61252.1 hypothetical protein Poli38472_013715 [Pythium oligandrum]
MLYPALWTLEHKPALSGVASECTIKFHSELSGKCHHESEPIVITVGNAFLGKYGGYIKVGLNLFSSLVPDMFGKAAIDKVVEVSIEQIDKAVQVHSLVEELDLVSSNDRRDMSRDRSLSPNETLHLLRELLHVKYDSDFDVLKMTKYTGLECAIVITRMTEPYVIASGTCVWASRDEIEQYTHALVFANDHVAPDSMASIHAATEEEWRKSREIAPEMEPQLSANHSSPCTERVESPGTDVTSRPTAMMMRIVSIQGLPNVRRVGKQRPYCRWRFIDINQRDVASDRTQPHDKDGLNPRWEAQPFWIKLPSDGATSFDGCTLYVMVETAGFVPGTCVMIAEGSHSFQDVAKTATIGKSDELSFNLSSSGKPAGRLHLAAKWDS